MARSRFSVIEKLSLWLFIGIGAFLIFGAPRSLALLGAGIIAVMSAILVLGGRRLAGTPYEHRDSAEFPNPPEAVFQATLHDMQEAPNWRLTLVDTNLRQIDAVGGTDTWSKRAVIWTILVTAIGEGRCKVETVFRATPNAAVTSQRLAADFRQRADKYLKVGLPLLLQRRTEQVLQEPPAASLRSVAPQASPVAPPSQHAHFRVSADNPQANPILHLSVRLVVAVFITFGILWPIAKFMTSGELPLGPKYFRVWCHFNDGSNKAWYFKDKDRAEMKRLSIVSKGHAYCETRQRLDGQPFKERTNEPHSQ